MEEEIDKEGLMKKQNHFRMFLVQGLTVLLGTFFSGCLNSTNNEENGVNFSLIVEVSGEGTVTPSPGTYHYEEKTLVDLKAEAHTDYDFSRSFWNSKK